MKRLFLLPLIWLLALSASFVPTGAAYGQKASIEGIIEGLGTLSRALTPKKHWVWPVSWTKTVTRSFYPPPPQAKPYAAGYHRGIDVAAPPETKVYAPDNALVHFAGTVAGRGVISLDHGDGLISSFEPLNSNLKKGARVRRGALLGVLDRAGHANRGQGLKGWLKQQGAEGLKYLGQGLGGLIGGALGPAASRVGSELGKKAVDVVLVNSGLSGGLHVGVRKNGVYMNPLLYFGLLEASVLLPRR